MTTVAQRWHGAAPVLLAALLGACAGLEQASSPRALAGFYQGDLPCADCTAIRYRLQLGADGTFLLEMHYLGEAGAPRGSFGTWTAAADGRALTLRAAGAEPLFFAPVEAGLRMLDREGRPIRSALGYELRRGAPPSPFEPSLRLSGWYRYMADAGLFRECHTGRSFPVAQEGDNAALERGYGAARDAPGAEVLVAVQARLAPRPKMEGAGLHDSLVVERFIGAWPGKACADTLPGAGTAP